jgi:hypothetical protein
MRLKVLWGLLLGVILVTGCARGPMGPAGPDGAQGPAGLTLLAEYTNNGNPLTSSDLNAGSFVVSTPELQHHIDTTIVEVYYQDNAGYIAHKWYPVSDGNGALLPYAAISWTDGTVTLYNVAAGDYILVKVFQHN